MKDWRMVFFVKKDALSCTLYGRVLARAFRITHVSSFFEPSCGLSFFTRFFVLLARLAAPALPGATQAGRLQHTAPSALHAEGARRER